MGASTPMPPRLLRSSARTEGNPPLGPSLRSAWPLRRAAPARLGPSAAMARVVSTPFWLRLGRGACGVGMGVEAPMLRELTRCGCSNAARQRVVSSAAHPASLPPQVCPFAQQRGRRLRGAFSLVTFFLRKKKVTAPPGAHPGQPHENTPQPTPSPLTYPTSRGNSGCSITAPAASSSASPGNSGEVFHPRGACRVSSPMKRTENTRLLPGPSNPPAPCRVSI